MCASGAWLDERLPPAPRPRSSSPPPTAAAAAKPGDPVCARLCSDDSFTPRTLVEGVVGAVVGVVLGWPVAVVVGETEGLVVGVGVEVAHGVPFGYSRPFSPAGPLPSGKVIVFGVWGAQERVDLVRPTRGNLDLEHQSTRSGGDGSVHDPEQPLRARSGPSTARCRTRRKPRCRSRPDRSWSRRPCRPARRWPRPHRAAPTQDTPAVSTSSAAVIARTAVLDASSRCSSRVRQGWDIGGRWGASVGARTAFWPTSRIRGSVQRCGSRSATQEWRDRVRKIRIALLLSVTSPRGGRSSTDADRFAVETVARVHQEADAAPPPTVTWVTPCPRPRAPWSEPPDRTATLASVCFSAQGDLLGGLVLGVIGWDAIRHVDRRRGHLALAALPLLFAAHQVDEAFVWWGLLGHVSAGVGHVATWIYLLFAFVVLPVYVPLAVHGLEPPGPRRRAMGAFVALGGIIRVLLTAMLVGPVTAGQARRLPHRLQRWPASGAGHRRRLRPRHLRGRCCFPAIDS